jgi:hypothetical protein
MRRKPLLCIAAAARVSITHTIGTPATHGVVVFFDFGYSREGGQFDTQGWLAFLVAGRSEGYAPHGPRFSLFRAHTSRLDQDKGRGSR